ncbi:OmpA family protein [Desulfonema magnum]|uniref:OmpA-like domain-containing protein n=1 Tax=Desulfonema magnum TaxID=45655 RepID=A0A975GNP6_9BACT|nr:OmpA family protein [Desulfonema magnum]QTA87073.1 OmpA-like domain-containing protein [Desulfonema magnum]
MIRQIILFLMVIFCFFFASCVKKCPICPILSQEIEKEREVAGKELAEFESGVRYLAKDVLYQLFRVPCDPDKREIITLKEFTNFDSENKRDTRKIIESLMAEEFTKGNRFTVALSDSSIRPDYILRCALSFEEFQGMRRPRLNVSVTDTDQLIIAQANVRFLSFDCPVSELSEKTRKDLMEFRPGIRYLARQMLCQLLEDSFSMRKKLIRFGEFNNLNPSYRLKAENNIMTFIIEELGDKFLFASKESEEQPDYIVEGTLFFDQETGHSVPHLQIRALDTESKIIRAKVSARFLSFPSDQSALDKQLAFAHEADKDEIRRSELNRGDEVPDESFPDLAIEKFIDKANNLFLEGEYQKAISLYEQILSAVEYGGQKFEKLCNLLYTAYYQEKELDKSGKYLRDLISEKVKSGTKIPFKPRFKQNSDDFIETEREEYEFILKTIGKYFKNNPDICFAVYGHTSITGSDRSNCFLSKLRAKKVADLLNISPERYKVIGRASANCNICTGENEADRRVEFKILKPGYEPEEVLPCMKYLKRQR